MSAKTFTRWTEEERRAHRRAQNANYQARKVEYLTDRQKQVKEEERKKRQETKQALEQGAWVTTKVEKKEKKEKTEKAEKAEKKIVSTKNVFAALETDEPEPETPETLETHDPKKINAPVGWGKQKINWADDSDDE